MKTIEEAATQSYINEVMTGGCNAGSTFGKEMFIKGIEFAQRWISVEEEIPPFGIRVLIKNKDGFEWFGHTNHRGCINYENKNTSCEPKITHWRPIEVL